MNDNEESNKLSLLVREDSDGPYLVGGKCNSCGSIFFPVQAICPRCTGQDIKEVSLSRKGKLWTYATVYTKPPDYEGPVPYTVGRVLLPEGVFIITQLTADKEALEVGSEMELILDQLYVDDSGNAVMGYKFKPA